MPASTTQDRTPKTAPKLWIVEIGDDVADIYERTSKGTKWVCEARMDQGAFHLDVGKPEKRYLLSDMEGMAAHPDDGHLFARCLADWLDLVRQRKAFDKAVLVATAGNMVDIRPALGKRLCACVKLASDETLAKNASEDRLAANMWF